MVQASQGAVALAVFLGGGAGALLRWATTQLVPPPVGTLAVNLVGSFALTILLHPSAGLSPLARAALGTGLLGGLTTYSTFNAEVVGYVLAGQPWRAAALAAATLAGAMLAGLLGHALAQAVLAGSAGS